jgi:hypothetical protein
MALSQEQEAELQKHLQPTIMDKIREYAMGHKGLGATDTNEAAAADNVDPVPPVQNFANGGIVKGLTDLVANTGIPVISDIANGKSLFDSFNPPPNQPAADPMAKAFAQEDYQSAPYKHEIPPVVDAAPPTPDTAVDTGDDDELRKSNPKVGSSHPGFNQDELEKYLLKEKQDFGKFGADHIADETQKMQDAHNSLGNSAIRGAATFADGLMQGVARAGNPGFASKIDANEARMNEMKQNAMKEENASNQAEVKERHGLDTQSSANALGASTADAIMPILRTMYPGKSDAEYAEMAHNPAVAQGLLPEQVKMYDAQKKLEAAKMQKEVALRTHQDQFDETRLQGLSRSLSADREYTNLRTKKDTLENVGKLIEQIDTQKDGADRRQAMELALSQVRTLIGTGQITEGEVHQMMPSTWRGNVATFMEKVANQPEGQESQYFVNRAKDFFRRENDLTNHQIDRRYNELAAPFAKVLGRNSDVKQNMDTTFSGRTAGQPTQSAPTITSQAQYDALPKGASYQDANGKPHVKGGR